MKIIIFILLAIHLQLAFASVSVLSDLDDTIKITQANGQTSDIFTGKLYTGIEETLQEMSQQFSDLYILSASPTVLKPKIVSVLKKRNIIFKELILRSNIFEDKFSYKLRKMIKMMESSQDDFILIGDDLGKDPEVYAEVTRLYPQRVLASYIHVVNGRTLPKGMIPYWTSFDLILKEYSSFRLAASSVERVIKALKEERNLLMIFPLKANCPTQPVVWEWQLQTIFMGEAFEFTQQYIKFCQLRQSDINSDR